MPKSVRTSPVIKPTPARRRVAILGATGSIGDSTLNVIDQQPDGFEIVALTAQDNVEKLISLARKYRPAMVAIGNAEHVSALKAALADMKIAVAGDESGIGEAAGIPADLTVCAIVGAAGLLPAMRAIEQGRTVAVANKETLVCAGQLVMQACRKHGTRLLPVDSEHNAIFQVFTTEHHGQVEKITLTASGGPFLNRSLETLGSVTPQEAVAHPRWQMGAKVSVDSATMMNKGLELIEAHYLFLMPPEKLDVLIHPESIVHSLVHYADGSVLAQLGMPDMRIPISYALSWPARFVLQTPRLDLAAIGALHFEPADVKRFPALTLARNALAEGPAHLIALNAANEIAVGRFLRGEVRFSDITAHVAKVLDATKSVSIRTIEDVWEADRAARALASRC